MGKDVSLGIFVNIYLAIPRSNTSVKDPSESVISLPILEGISSKERPDDLISASASSVKD